MSIPKKALRKSQLEELTAGSAVNDGSHQIIRVEFLEKGIKKKGFFKAIDPEHHYPELLALISVATSAFKRSFQGNNAAEERLVFDDSDKLVGTLSIAIDGFKPFNCLGDAEPLDLSAKELVVPSTKTLIEKNFMAVLFGRYFLDDDDSHPRNVGFAGDNGVDIDYDMFWYWFTIHMKEPRPIIGVPKKRVTLTKDDWECFPRTKDAKHYHWPTYVYPGQETLPTVLPAQSSILPKALPKTYADPTQFQQLANSAVAQDQKLAAALKILITYQPEVMRARLTELFDVMPLNYTSLGSVLSSKYETEFPLLCNERTNVKPFVDFMMNLYQEHYDSLYRVVVFYMGCDNNGYGVPLPATHHALYKKPSFFQNILAWVKGQNATVYGDDDRAVKYNVEAVQKRYHQIWRDAFAPSLKALLHDSFNLTNKLIEAATPRILDASFVLLTPPEGKKTTDESLTNAWQLFGTLDALPKEEISRSSELALGKESKLREGLLLLVDFTNEFHAIAKAYYEKECSALTESDNLTFVEAIGKLYTKYNLPIRQNLANTSTYANLFNPIAVSLKQFAEQANFQLHLTTTDEQMQEVTTSVTLKDLLPHTHPDIMAQFNDSLFVWARIIKPDELTRLINSIIDTHYAPYVETLSRRGRAGPVKAYLEASKGERGDNRLAYILSSGNPVGALNTLLIEHLAPQVLLTHSIPSIDKAIKAGTFHTDIQTITREAVQFAVSDSRFMHLNHQAGKELFYKTLFDWVDSIKPSEFTGLIDSALSEYEAGLSWFSTSRREEVKGYCKAYGQAKALGMTFINGRVTSTLNETLFHKIVNAIKTDIKRDKGKHTHEGYKLIAQYSIDQHKEEYLKEIQVCSVEATHRKPASQKSSVLTM
ncbi:hypothetical protein [Legionella sp. km772]|uniref:hypothetical protein n=1 Tax=Legionella sp. km772 TaxID=2498111 RepID=UPI000F8CD5A5|nr:hypothetical protein [Legionella sp. km772]RUR11666.1 hypothetical protein ELY15_06800 [Legionella sp. km772]